MPSRSLARPAAVFAATALVLASTLAAATQPEVPPVASIPVAPLPKPKKVVVSPAPATPPATTTTTVVTTTVTTPSLAAMSTEPDAPARGVPEAMPVAPGPVPPPVATPRVLLVDEAPFKVGHARARELPEHEHGRHGNKKGRHGRLFHPAPGIVVEVSNAQGGANAADLQKAARSVGYWPLRHCYEEGLRRNQQLGGSVSFEIGRQSGDQAAQLTESTVHDQSVTLCVLREARHLQLPWGEGAETTADVKVTLATGDEPVPTPHVVPHADELREALHASWPAVQQCYASELTKRPEAGGRMELKFRAKSSGEILEVSEEEPRFGDVDVTRCVLGAYRTAKLPHLHGSHAGTFVYALHFEAAAGNAPASSK
jgi:hypothetical protein